MATSPNLGITYLDTAGQAGAETLINELIITIDALVFLTVVNRTTTSPPGSPTNGDRYLIAATATGDWAGKEDQIAGYYDGWRYWTPQEGWRLYDKSDNTLYKATTATSWTAV